MVEKTISGKDLMEHLKAVDTFSKDVLELLNILDDLTNLDSPELNNAKIKVAIGGALVLLSGVSLLTSSE